MYFNNSLFSVDVCAQYKTAICHNCHLNHCVVFNSTS